ncbi:phosphonate metabolism protein/1,5-bisphosphokinase (PRPP-forming) PhnN [Pseudooceanicola sp. C21-150M6]|uniref:phosphonate metabolism protein/1,5-bisphosphokinase (PRPP-forming) PhnN n=1 Tax=Pseudooceanicola sp. C21-150M6 TaxID=3434355 RepID=UPI003D7F405A
MTGRLYGVVGPSGVGKDTVMAAVAARRPGLHIVRRVITRAAEAGGEVYEAVDRAEFMARVAAGDFALWWEAHGLCYGVPASVGDELARGGDAMVNLSRAVLGEAEARFPGFTVLSLTASPEVLARRLAQRGRESEEEIARRLARAGYALPEGLARVVVIGNDGPLAQTVGAVLAAMDAGRVSAKEEVTE